MEGIREQLSRPMILRRVFRKRLSLRSGIDYPLHHPPLLPLSLHNTHVGFRLRQTCR